MLFGGRPRFLISFWKIFIYLVAPGLSCGTQDLQSLSRYMGSSSPIPLTTGPSGKSQEFIFLTLGCCWCSCSGHYTLNRKELNGDWGALLCIVTETCLTLLWPWTIAYQASLSMGFFRQEILEWAAISFFRGSSQPRDQTPISCVSCTAGRFFTQWAIWEVL